MPAQSISVDDSKNAVDLVNILTNNSSCATISSQNISGNNAIPAENSYGYFNNINGNFPFKDGIVLSTWGSKYSEGPFIREPINGPNSGNSNWKGDSDLEQALGITNTTNATILEFDFVPLTNIISFNYLFASNEYLDNYPCNYSDGFAFLIKETGTSTYENLAVLPGTTTPVSSQNVHPLIPTFNSSTGPKPGCPAKNETYFGSLNTGTTNSSAINYAGQTVVMNAQTNVTIGKTYHIKLVVADHNGELYDSAIFLEAGSFSAKVDLGTNRLLATNNAVCFGQDFIIDTKLPSTYTFNWYKDNVLLTGENGSTYTAKNTGSYKVEVIMSPSNCIATNEIKVEYTPEIILNNSTLIQCDDNGDGITNFDLTKVDSDIKNNNTSLSAVEYYESLTDAQNSSNKIQNSTNYSNKSQNQILIAKVSDTYGCANYAELTLQISNQTIPTQNPVIKCDDDNLQDGYREFNLNNEVSPQLLNGLPNGLSVEYYLNTADAYSQKNAIPNLLTNTIQNQQVIYARIVNGTDCYNITPITLKVNIFSPINFQDEYIPLCSNSSINIGVNSGFLTYLWNTGETLNTINITSPGDYSITVTNANGCNAIKNFHITNSEIATITGVKMNDFSGNENSVIIEYTGAGDYEFSIDGNYYQDNPEFKNLSAGIYSAYARDKNGCGLSIPFKVTILDYPRYFTPNGDGYNDIWYIKNLNQLPASVINIFDRYGKLLKQFSSTSLGWDGSVNGYSLPSDDYWFNLNFKDGKIIKGHFSLKR
jgi:gliding motility-associated-like protein